MKRKRVHKAVVMEVSQHGGGFEAMCLETREVAPACLYVYDQDVPAIDRAVDALRQFECCPARHVHA